MISCNTLIMKMLEVARKAMEDNEKYSADRQTINVDFDTRSLFDEVVSDLKKERRRKVTQKEALRFLVDSFRKTRPTQINSPTNLLTTVNRSEIILSRPDDKPLLIRVIKILDKHPSERARIDGMIAGVEEKYAKGPPVDDKSRGKKSRQDALQDGRRGA